MSIRPKLFEYLDHCGRTATVRELASHPGARDIIALRHDIDHNLDIALELAHHEHNRGLRATYFLLHTHDYFSDPDFALKCRQLQAYGHEVGLHVNVLTQWMAGECDDVDARIGEVLQTLRSAGVDVVGVSAHGDRACYERGFSNYWIWRELRGDQPAERQRGRSAEGIAVENPRWHVDYPRDDALRRADGATLKLWQSSLRVHGLEYDAVHVPVDHYWSDTGGSWSRTGDPLASDLSRGRHQVLIHPWWWRGPRRLYVFLSTARAGTKWLSHFIDRATPCRSVHEFTFNHRYEDGSLIEDKRTTDDFDTISGDRSLAVSLIRQSLRWMKQQPGDVAEANVYLEPFITELRELEPAAILVHLHRDGRDVVRSILGRDWYASPQDHKHRAVPIERWDDLTQFERACWYWRYTNESIMPHVTARLSFERMVADRAYLTQQLDRLGIIVHPLLAEHVFDRPLNATGEHAFAACESWPPQYRATFHHICGPMQRQLGYSDADESIAGAPTARTIETEHAASPPRTVLDLDFRGAAAPPTTPSHVETKPSDHGLVIRPSPPNEGASNLVLMLTRGQWNTVAAKRGIACDQNVYYLCHVDAIVRGPLRVRVFVLYYDRRERQVRKLQLGAIRADEPARTMSFSPALGASHFSLALHLGGAHPDQHVLLRRVRVEQCPMDRSYAAPQAVPAHQPALHDNTLFDQPEALRALCLPPDDPLSEPGANFPLGFYEDMLKEIRRLGIVVLTYDDIFEGSDDWDYASNYASEFKHWQKHRRDPSTTYLVIQHDVDNHPHFTKRMVAMEFLHGIRSNIFLFNRRYSRKLSDPDYPVDHDFFRAAADRGFVIGYHQNAFQLAGFDMDSAVEQYRHDVTALRECYDIRYVVPHGGVGAEVDGTTLHNFNVPMPEELRTNLRWVFNGHGVRFSRRWSDGGLRRARDHKTIRDYNIIERFLQQLKPGTRNFCLIHPQRWGFNIEVDANSLLAEQPWYLQLCRQYTGTVCTSVHDAGQSSGVNEVASSAGK